MTDKTKMTIRAGLLRLEYYTQQEQLLTRELLDINMAQSPTIYKIISNRIVKLRKLIRDNEKFEKMKNEINSL